MPKQGGWNNHARVIAAAIDLDVGTTGQGHLHFDQDLALFDVRNRNFLDFYVFFAVEDGSRHFSVHNEFPSHALPG